FQLSCGVGRRARPIFTLFRSTYLVLLCGKKGLKSSQQTNLKIASVQQIFCIIEKINGLAVK
ncbi:hypothetical protein ACE1CI_10230, partial [Aerosakkonemataceae cyanobacterium BLCC-F50]